ncbi:hypothetical protein L596_017224 [Steinernema carpocapsae]|uniref:BTB domain-containing protein n=1 Tax=Steinernema carpocapsae TaxID=34508 RepID=A0A4U5N1D1_STECR|nr:hypothetical protein L596_017224 [Steinernema carpocapsae]
MLGKPFTFNLNFNLEDLTETAIRSNTHDICVWISHNFLEQAIAWSELGFKMLVKADQSVGLIKGTPRFGHNVQFHLSVNSAKYYEKAKVSIETTLIVKKSKKFQFKEFKEGLADVKVTLRDDTFYVSKLFLSMHSAYFETMFRSNVFLEGQNNTCNLADVNSEEFMVLLYMAYGLPVDYDFFLKQGYLPSIIVIVDRLQFAVMMAEIEEFLMTLSQEKIVDWIEVAEQYQLIKLQKAIQDIIKNKDEKGDQENLKNNYHEAPNFGFVKNIRDWIRQVTGC